MLQRSPTGYGNKSQNTSRKRKRPNERRNGTEQKEITNKTKRYKAKDTVKATKLVTSENIPNYR